MKWFVVSLLLAITGASAQLAVAACTTTTIKIPAKRYNTTPTAINKNGFVVGSFQDVNIYEHGFTWVNGTATIYDYPGATQTFLSGVNDTRTIVGSYLDDQGAGFAFVLHKDGHTTQFSVPNAYNTFAYGINNQDEIVGASAAYRSNYVGFKKVGNTFETIQFPGAENTFAVGINDSGVIVGYYTDATTNHGFTESNGVYTTVDFPNSYYSQAHGINNKGEIVGQVRQTVDSHTKAYTDKNGKFTKYRYPSALFTEFNAVNVFGDRVGDAATKDNGGILSGPGFVFTCR